MKKSTLTYLPPYMSRFNLFLLIAVITVPGCQQIPRDKETANFHSREARQQTLEKLQHWRVKGKLLFKSPEKKQSVSLNWTQDHSRADLRLTTFMGISVLKMISDQHSATLEADGKTVTSNNPQRLLARTTGIALPVNELRYWMKGATSQNNQDQQVQLLDEYNRVSQIRLLDGNFQPWQIDYQQYMTIPLSKQINQQQSVQLPQKIRLSGNDMQITITIKDWELIND